MHSRHFNDQELTKREKLNRLQKDQHDPFAITKFIRNFNTLTFRKQFDHLDKATLVNDATKIIISGRIMAIRQTFGVLQDM
jgi:lysyl-tRNA synthetase class 2